MKTSSITVAVLLVFAAVARAEVSLKVADASAASGAKAEVSILISGSQNIGSLQFVLDYDPRLLEPLAIKPGQESKAIAFGKALKGAALEQNAAGAGEWKIALVPDEAISDEGELLRLRFRVKGKTGESCVLTLDRAMAWEKESHFEVPLTTQLGTITITGSRFPRWGILAAVVALAVIAAAIFVFLRGRREAKPEAAPTEPPAAGQEAR